MISIGVESSPLSITFESNGNVWLVSYKSSIGNTTMIKYSPENDTYAFYEFSDDPGQIRSFLVEIIADDQYLVSFFYDSSSSTEGKC